MKSNNIDNSIISLLLVVMSVMIALIAFTLTSCTKIDDVEIPNNDTITVRELSVIDIGIVDGSGNRYDTIRIGNQIWLDANLVTTKYNDSTDILYPGTDKNQWISSNEGCYAWYNNDSASYSVYGALYNWKAVMSNKLCPVGYHVPTDNEWQQLEMYLGMSAYDANRYGIRGNNNEGGRLKGLSYWSQPNIGAVNQYGFNAIPSNIRFYNGEFWPWQYNGKESVTYWTSTYDSNLNLAINRSLETNHGSIWRYRHSVLMGYSVRCIKN
jgi:uncharacterized protein (TIGR02145 family)